MLEQLLRWLPWLLALALSLLWLSLQWDKPIDSLQRGVNFVAYEPSAYAQPSVDNHLVHLRSMGVDWVAVVVTWYQNSLESTEIEADPQRTPSDEALLYLLGRLKNSGFKVLLRPMVDVYDGSWRGNIAFAQEAEWQTWFRSYESFLLHYVEIAKAHDVSLFSVGVELEESVHQESLWRNLISRVRSKFSGLLTYSANWDGFERVLFWSALDYVGIDAYFDLDFPLTVVEPTPATLITAWQPWVQQMDRFASETGKPILLTELGTRSVQGSSRQPWDWQREAPISLSEQANYYEAAFQVFWDKPWLAGIYWWAWQPDAITREANDGYTPYGKPAEAVLKAWYQKAR